MLIREDIMHSSSIYVVYKEEHHSIHTCPCEACDKERLRRKKKSTSKSHISIPPSTAYLFGFIQSRQSNGSLARELMLDKNSD